MTRYSTQPYHFDQLFMSHLGSKLRPEYASLMSSPLPQRQWELLLDLEVAQATLDLEEKRHRRTMKVVPRLPT